MIPNLQAFLSGQISYADLMKDVQYRDLYTSTDELFQTMQTLIEGATDSTVTFVPRDEALQNPEEQGWTLAHVVNHFTASLEETASVAVTLARGISLESRLRYEVPWEETRTIQQVRDRMQESHRMCRAFLDAWPSTPNLDITVERIPHFGPLNAIRMYMLGILHGERHIGQVREIMKQAKEQGK